MTYRIKTERLCTPLLFLFNLVIHDLNKFNMSEGNIIYIYRKLISGDIKNFEKRSNFPGIDFSLVYGVFSR